VKHVEITKEVITRWFHKLRKNLYIKKLNIFRTTSASSGVQKCLRNANRSSIGTLAVLVKDRATYRSLAWLEF
jgi:hypothetical protein